MEIADGVGIFRSNSPTHWVFHIANKYISSLQSGLRTRIPQNLRPPAADLSGLSQPEVPIGMQVYDEIGGV